MKKYRFLSLLLAAFLALSLSAPALALEDPQPQARAVIIVDGDNDEILYDFNAHTRTYPASITKIMTSLVVLDAVAQGKITLDTAVTASAQAVDLPWGSSTAGIKAGEILTVESLLYCDLLPSGNEACNILAEAVAGTTAEFVSLMNAKAQELGMKDTHFANPHGLHDPEHYTTAYDIYLMAQAAMQNETFRTIVRSPSHNLPATNLQEARTIYSSNGLLSTFYAGAGYTYSKAIGIKTGYTGEAGRCLASAAVDELGRTFYCVVLGTEDTVDNNVRHYWSFSETKRLLEWAFQNFHRTTLLNQDSDNVIREVAVTLSDEADHVLAQPVGELAATMPSDFDFAQAKLDFDLYGPVEAPVALGQKLGTVTFTYDGVTYGTLDMVAMSSVERSEFLYTIQQIQFYWSKGWVKAAVIGGAALVLLAASYLALIRPRRKRARRYSYSGGSRRGGSNYRGRR